MAAKQKQETTTALVVRALAATDDFMDYAMLKKATGRSGSQLSAACWSLKVHRVIDVEVNADGKAWWYLRPAEDDIRIRHLDERAPEIKPRKRKSRYPVAKTS